MGGRGGAPPARGPYGASSVAYAIRARAGARDGGRAGREGQDVGPGSRGQRRQRRRRPRRQRAVGREPVQQRRVHRVARADRVGHLAPYRRDVQGRPAPRPYRQPLRAPRQHHRRRPGREPLLHRPAQPRRVVLRQLQQRDVRKPALEAGPVGVRVRDQAGPDVRIEQGEQSAPRLTSQQRLVRARPRLQHQRTRAERQRPYAGGERRGRQLEEAVRAAFGVEAVPGRPVGTQRRHRQRRRLRTALHERGVHPGRPQPVDESLAEAVRRDAGAERGAGAQPPQGDSGVVRPAAEPRQQRRQCARPLRHQVDQGLSGDDDHGPERNPSQPRRTARRTPGGQPQDSPCESHRSPPVSSGLSPNP